MILKRFFRYYSHDPFIFTIGVHTIAIFTAVRVDASRQKVTSVLLYTRYCTRQVVNELQIVYSQAPYNLSQ
jgi:hypothetical protein